MELSKNDTNILKGIAILLMVTLHLFATKSIEGSFSSLMINGTPLTYYFGLMGDACVPIYLFVTGYAFYTITINSNGSIFMRHLVRTLKLYSNLWVVFIIFIPLGFIFKEFSNNTTFDTFNPMKLLLNFLGLNSSYNGAWWFLQVYVTFVVLSPILIKIVRKMNYLLLVLILGVTYMGAHFQLTLQIIYFDNVVDQYLLVVGKFATSMFSFVIGAVFAKEKLYTKIYNKCNDIRFKNTLCLIGFGSLILLHAVIQSSIIAPFNAISIICLFMLLDKPKSILKPLDFIGNHSTNIWLTHMFFYSTIFTDFVYIFDNPILLYLWLITLCVITSYGIKLFTTPAFKLIDKIPVGNGKHQVNRRTSLARD